MYVFLAVLAIVYFFVNIAQRVKKFVFKYFFVVTLLHGNKLGTVGIPVYGLPFKEVEVDMKP